MTIVVIGGTQHAPLAALEAYLQARGLAAALPSEASEVRTVHDWVERYFASGVPAAPVEAGNTPRKKSSWLARVFGKTEPPPLALHAVSTPWLLSISNLIIANANQPAWGWADRRNGHLIGLWLDLDPNTRFVGLITPPEQELAAAQQASATPIDAAGVLAVWRQTTEHLLAMQREHPQRVRLLETRTATAKEGGALVQWLALSAGQEPEAAEAAPLPTPDPLITSTLARVAKEDAATAALWRAVQTQLGLPPRAIEEDSAGVAQALLTLSENLKAVTAQRDAEAQAKQAAAAERDAKAKLAEERAAANTQLQQEVAELKAQRDAEAQAKQAAAAERDALQQRLQEQQSQITELQEESDLLLAQLHQVQEELEQYFLQAQSLKQDKEKLEQRINRLLQRLPDGVEWEDLAVEATKTSLTLTLKELQTAQRQLPQLKLVVTRQKKQPTLQVVDEEGSPPALLHGPLQSALMPTAQPNTPEAAALNDLATSDVDLLRQVCASVASALPSTTTGRQQWATDLETLAAQLQALPPAWRYDRVTLVNEQVTPGYEHLWFRFENASFADRSWQSFELRLAAANVRKGQLSLHPRLEFPAPNPGLPKQFENWFEESEDEHGVKLELRFDLRQNLMDMDVWAALSVDDQRQMIALLLGLPSAINALEQQGVRLRRNPQEWQNSIGGMLGALSKGIGVVA
jgi:hypothetical protein